MYFVLRKDGVKPRQAAPGARAEAMIQLEGLSRSIGKTPALAGVSLEVRAGALFAPAARCVNQARD